MARRGNCLPSALIVALAKAKQRSSDEQVDPEDEGEHDHDEPDEYRIDACGHVSTFVSSLKAVSGRKPSPVLLSPVSALVLRWRNDKLTKYRPVWLTQASGKPTVVGDVKFGVCGSVPPRIGVTPGIEQGEVARVGDAWLVGVTRDDDARVFLPAEQSQCVLAVFVAVTECDPNVTTEPLLIEVDHPRRG
jgi:hypothetical protein